VVKVVNNLVALSAAVSNIVLCFDMQILVYTDRILTMLWHRALKWHPV